MKSKIINSQKYIDCVSSVCSLPVSYLIGIYFGIVVYRKIICYVLGSMVFLAAVPRVTTATIAGSILTVGYRVLILLHPWFTGSAELKLLANKVSIIYIAIWRQWLLRSLYRMKATKEMTFTLYFQYKMSIWFVNANRLGFGLLQLRNNNSFPVRPVVFVPCILLSQCP